MSMSTNDQDAGASASRRSRTPTQRSPFGSHPRRTHALATLALASAGVLLLAACGSATSASPKARGVALRGGTATFAMNHGDQFNWILPLPNEASYDPYQQNS